MNFKWKNVIMKLIKKKIISFWDTLYYVFVLYVDRRMKFFSLLFRQFTNESYVKSWYICSMYIIMWQITSRKKPNKSHGFNEKKKETIVYKSWNDDITSKSNAFFVQLFFWEFFKLFFQFPSLHFKLSAVCLQFFQN